jgi:hypothetical protein
VSAIAPQHVLRSRPKGSATGLNAALHHCAHTACKTDILLALGKDEVIECDGGNLFTW